MENVPAVQGDKREIGEAITKELILSYMESFGIGGTLTANEKTQFINVAVAYRLNPFKREIYCNPYETKNGRKLSIITGYEVYLKRAERIGDLDGWKVTTTGSIKDHNLKAQITIHRKSWKQPFEHEVEFSEYNLNRSVWLDKPVTMIKKVVTAQGFRLAFPDELGGMPYTADELPSEMTGTTEVKAEAPTERKGPVQATATAAAPTIAEVEALRLKKAEEFKKANPLGMDGKLGKTPPVPAAPPQEDVKHTSNVTGFVLSMGEANKGGYVKTFLEDQMDEDGKKIGFSSNDEIILETIAEHMNKGEKVTLEYTTSQNGRWVNYSIVGLVSVQEPAGQPGD